MNLEGNAYLNGSSFLLNGKKFYWKERKKELEKKPKYYLANIEGKQYTYISSLYFNGEEGLYKFDYKEIKYIIERKENYITIKKI